MGWDVRYRSQKELDRQSGGDVWRKCWSCKESGRIGLTKGPDRALLEDGAASRDRSWPMQKSVQEGDQG